MENKVTCCCCWITIVHSKLRRRLKLISRNIRWLVWGLGHRLVWGRIWLLVKWFWHIIEIMSPVNNIWSPPSEDTVHISCMMEMIANNIMPLYCLKDTWRTFTLTLSTFFPPFLVDLFKNKRFVHLNWQLHSSGFEVTQLWMASNITWYYYLLSNISSWYLTSPVPCKEQAACCRSL